MAQLILIATLFLVTILVVSSFQYSSQRFFRNAPLYMVNPKPSGFANTKEGKAVILERTKALLGQSSLVIAVPANGITKEQVDILRKEIPSTTKASVVKNSLMKKAVEGTPFSAIQGNLKNQNLFFFIKEGEAKGTYDAFKKWQKEAKRTEEAFAAKFAATDGQLFNGKSVEAVVNLPTRKELITKIAQGIKSVPTKVARSIKAVPEKVGRAVRAIKEQKEKQE